MLSWNETLLLSVCYLFSCGLILVLTYRSFVKQRFSFHLLFTLIYLSVFYLGFPFSMGLALGFGVNLLPFSILLQTWLVSTVFYLIYYAAYHIRIWPKPMIVSIKIPQEALNSNTEANITALFLFLISFVTMAVFLAMNGILLFKLEAYSQIFSSQVSGVALKRFFYFFIPGLLIIYFLYPNRKMWWFFLIIGVTLGMFNYLLIGGTRANVALVIALFIFIGIAQKYISVFTLICAGIVGIIGMFILALGRYSLDLNESQGFYYFLQLTRDTFSPWENLSRILYDKHIEFQGIAPIIRDFYVYIPKSLWENRPDLIMNTANYFTWNILNYHAGLAISPTLIGSFYIMGGIPLSFIGAVLIGWIIKGFDKLYFYAKQLPQKQHSAILQSYCFANIFPVTVLVREGIDAFVSRFIFFSLVFLSCYFLMKWLTVMLGKNKSKKQS